MFVIFDEEADYLDGNEPRERDVMDWLDEINERVSEMIDYYCGCPEEDEKPCYNDQVMAQLKCPWCGWTDCEEGEGERLRREGSQYGEDGQYGKDKEIRREGNRGKGWQYNEEGEDDYGLKEPHIHVEDVR